MDEALVCYYSGQSFVALQYYFFYFFSYYYDYQLSKAPRSFGDEVLRCYHGHFTSFHMITIPSPAILLVLLGHSRIDEALFISLYKAVFSLIKQYVHVALLVHQFCFK